MVYCKSYLADGISIVKKNEKGIMWVKFDKTFFELQCDIFFCLCYIPPENSRLYSNGNSLSNFDYFECITDDIRYFSNTDDVYLCGDFNSRTGQLSDSVEQLGLERYIDLPCDDEQAFEIKIGHLLTPLLMFLVIN